MTILSTDMARMKPNSGVPTHGAWVLTLILACMVLLTTSACGAERGDSQKGLGTTKSVETLGNLRFHRNKESAMKQAKTTNRPVFVDFYANWCVNCKLFNKLVIQKGALNSALKKVVLLKIYDTDPIFKEFRQKEDFKELRVGLPLFAILNPDGSLRWKTTDYKDSAGMIKHLQ